MIPEIRITGPKTLPAFIALAEAQASWLWARGIRQWKPGSIRAKHAELADKLAQGWLVTAVVPGANAAGCRDPDIVAGCLLTLLVPPEWQGRAGAGTAGPAYLERLAVARPFAGRGLSQSVVAACADLARGHGLGALRLDCWAGNETLKALYRGQGFCAVAEVTSEGHLITLFEKTVWDGASN